MRKKALQIILFVFSMNLLGLAQAQTHIGPVPIMKIRTGWAADIFALETGKEIANPAACPVADGYFSSLKDPGYKTHYALALMAFSMNKNVIVIISNQGCTENRPRIMGIYIEK